MTPLSQPFVDSFFLKENHFSYVLTCNMFPITKQSIFSITICLAKKELEIRIEKIIILKKGNRVDIDG